MTDAAAFDALPLGAFTATWRGRTWRATRSRFTGGRSQKLFAREAGGKEIVSANLYLLSDGRTLLRPCEMPAEKVRSFLLGAVVAGGTNATGRI